jgi:hypothetical protein
MNKLNSEIFRNKIFRQVRSSNRSGSHNGCVRIFPNNTFEHERVKFEICYKLLGEGWDILTEAIFTNGKRCDILAVSKGRAVIIEIETPKSKKELDKKMLSKKEYPDFEMILVITDKFDRETFEI